MLDKHDNETLRTLAKHLRREASNCVKLIQRGEETRGDLKALEWRIQQLGLVRRLLWAR